MRHRYALLAVLLPVIAACSNDSANETASSVAATTTSIAAVEVTTTVAAEDPPTSPMPAAPTTTVMATVDEAGVGIADFAFTPTEVRVPAGGSVVWTNSDAQQHTATSAGAFDSGSIQPQTSVAVAFPTAGTFAYICSFHPFMTGTVVVV